MRFICHRIIITLHLLAVVWFMLTIGCKGAISHGPDDQTSGDTLPGDPAANIDMPLRQLGELNGILIGTEMNPVYTYDPSSTYHPLGYVFHDRLGNVINNPPADPQYDGPYEQLLHEQFDLIYPGNNFKLALIHPQKDLYNFTLTDYLVAYAKYNHLAIQGHTLVWGNKNTLPSWLTNPIWTRDTLIVEMQNHIQTIMSRYSGKVRAWDIVNEAFCDPSAETNCCALGSTTCVAPAPGKGGMDGSPLGGTEGSLWRNTIGPDFIEIALTAARAADPNALIYINDNGNEYNNTPKSDAMYEYVADLVARGVPIDGIGMQMHMHVDGVPPGFATMEEALATAKAQATANFARFNALGLFVAITELDVPLANSIYSNQALTWQAEIYAMMLDVCLSAANCPFVNVWGFTDKYSWIPNSQPLYDNADLYDYQLQPKPALDAFKQVLVDHAP